MKTTCTIFLFFFAVIANAQITYTANLPVANKALIKTHVSNGNIIDTSKIGPNQTWDFSALTPSYPDTTFYFNPSDGPYMGDTAFPLSYLAAKETNSNEFQYFSNTNGDFLFDGQCSPDDAAVMKFTPKMKYMPNTLNYNDVISENPVAVMYSKMPYGQIVLDIRVTISINRKLTVDSWGSLKTPKGTFNTLRVKQVLISTMTSEMNMGSGWTPAGAPSTNTETSFIWLGNTDNVLLEVEYDSDSSKLVASYPEKTIDYTYQYNNTVGINKINSNISTELYPNPTSDMITLTKSTADKVELTIYNTFGSEVYSQSLIDNSTSINIQNLSNGIYFYTLQSKGQMIKTNSFIKN